MFGGELREEKIAELQRRRRVSESRVFAGELRSRERLEQDYFAGLHRHGVAHVYNAWAKMPALGRQIRCGS